MEEGLRQVQLSSFSSSAQRRTYMDCQKKRVELVGWSSAGLSVEMEDELLGIGSDRRRTDDGLG